MRLVLVDVEPVSVELPADHVFERFRLDGKLTVIPVLSGSDPVGLVTRHRFYREHAARYGCPEHAAPISRFMEPSPLLVDDSVALDEIVEAIIENGEHHLRDGFVVTHAGRYLGVGTGRRLVQALAEHGQDRRHRVAYHDPLTGLPNRPLFDDRLTYALAAAERSRGRLAVIIVDLDQFRTVNDAQGSAVGDDLLKRVGSRLRQAIRKGDTVARLGSDDFGIVLPHVPHVEAARLVARKIVESFATPFHVDGADVSVSCSTGLAVFPDDASSASRLMRCAGQALKHAKQVRYGTDGFDAPAPGEADGICSYSSLRRAIEQQRLVLVYQPQVDLVTGRICGVEALVRWPEEDGPTVPANEIIAVAESSGLIAPLAEWVLASACRQMRAWHDEGVFVVRMAVNVSGVQLRQHALTSIVERTLADTGVPPAALELELTEAVVMQHDDGFVMDALRALKGLGVRLSIDDFGTGSTCLRRLAQLPVDSLKLDRAFVESLGHDERAAVLASAVIAMAHRLGLKVIAEGVETAEQLRTLRNHRCDVMQGYYFSRPVSPLEVAKLVGRGTFDADAWPDGPHE